MAVLVRTQITVLFEDPFWVALYERESGEKYEVCKITFGAEPKDYEVYEFLLKNHKKLPFSPAVSVCGFEEKRISPKRRQREAKKATEQNGIGTKAQQALKLQHEQNKIERKARTKEMKEAEKKLRFEQKQEKKKQKHNGH
ncbi:MAG: YjdF family protein [Clostridiaceae bacterium]|nr:YjdF family protein [Clostridiaceae bacterium]